MPDNTIPQKAARTAIVHGGTAGTEPGDQGQSETKRVRQPAGRFKTISRQIAALALDILEQIE